MIKHIVDESIYLSRAEIRRRAVIELIMDSLFLMFYFSYFPIFFPLILYSFVLNTVLIFSLNSKYKFNFLSFGNVGAVSLFFFIITSKYITGSLNGIYIIFHSLLFIILLSPNKIFST